MTKTKKAEKFPPIKELSCDAIHETPVSRDWSEGCGETWEYVESVRCKKCGEAVLVSGAGEDMHKTIDSESECDGYVGSAEGPMMNYFYPLPDLRNGLYEGYDGWGRANMSEGSAAHQIVDLPLCVVTIGDDQGLALTGGGMNLAWEICEGYMRLGFLPPTHFADLPRMGGRGESKRDRWVLAGCRRSLEVAILQARHGLRSLRSFSKKRA